jgi:hypothetical protein
MRKPARNFAQKFAPALLALAILALALSVGGCSAKAKPGVVGTWRSADTVGKAGSLSDLTLNADGTFFYAGKNALGGSVRFGGRYRVGEQDGAPWMQLAYDDYPDRNVVWFYKIEGSQLSASTMRGNLTNGSAMVFTRQ